MLEALAGIEAEPAEAARYLEEAVRIAKDCGDRSLHARLLTALARLIEADDPARARETLKNAARIFAEVGLPVEDGAARDHRPAASA